MVPALVRKTWRDDRAGYLGWAIGLGAFIVLYTSFYDRFRDVAELKQQAFPPEMLDLLGVSDLISPAGYLQSTVFSLVGPLLVIMCAVTLAIRTIAGAEEGGDLELLLANPMSRQAFAWQRLAAAGTALTVIAAVPWALLTIIVPAVGMDLSLSHVAAASAGLIALAWCFAGIGFLTGAATGRPGRAAAITGVIAVGTYVVHALAGLVGGLDWLTYLSPFRYAIGTNPLLTGWHLPELLVLVAVAAVTSSAGVVLFHRRDVSV
jgi:ABC-2 type transport system permease protein